MERNQLSLLFTAHALLQAEHNDGRPSSKWDEGVETRDALLIYLWN